MGIFNFPSNFVYWENVKNHDEIKRIILSKVEMFKEKYKYNKPGLYNASTSYDTDLKQIIDEDLCKDLIWNPLENAIKELNSRPNTPKIQIDSSIIANSWYTFYEKGGSFNYHDHDGPGRIENHKIYNPSFSMIYILKDENDHNSTTFLEHSHQYGSVYSRTNQHCLNTQYLEDIKEGTILIFPSSLQHCVQAIEIPGRITIAINIVSN